MLILVDTVVINAELPVGGFGAAVTIREVVDHEGNNELLVRGTPLGTNCLIKVLREWGYLYIYSLVSTGDRVVYICTTTYIGEAGNPKESANTLHSPGFGSIEGISGSQET